MPERTEAPTPRHRQQVRSRGQVARSMEITAAIALLGSALALRLFGPWMFQQLASGLRESLRSLSNPAVFAVSTQGTALTWGFLGIMAPIFTVVAVLGVASNYVQGSVVLSAYPLRPDFSRLNPLQGLARIFSGRSLVELLKMIGKVSIIGVVVYQVLSERLLGLGPLLGSDLPRASQVLADAGFELGFKAGLAMLIMAALDYAYQRWTYERRLRMTREELREEMRQGEGSPEMRGRIRQQQRRLASQRMIQAVPRADVIVVNPVEVAVALQYNAEGMRAPVVVAKGLRLLAQRIKDVARESDVPIVENRPLAQALYRSVEIGVEIPPALYQAVAEVLAFIYSLKGKSRVR